MAFTDFLQKSSFSLGELLQRNKSKSVLGVDVSSSMIKVVQLSKKGGKAILETYGELALGPYAGVDIGKATKLPTEKMAEALVDLMKEAKVSTPECGVAIPLSASLINVISMPDVGEEQLRQMVPIEMRKYIPVSITEVTLDWEIIPTSEERGEEGKRPTVDILVIAIHNETIRVYQEIIKKANLRASFLEIEAFSTIRSVLVDTRGPLLVVDIGAGTTKVYVVDHRVLRESHIINRGVQDVTLAIAKSLGVSSEEATDLRRSGGLSGGSENENVREVVSLVLDNIFSEAHRALLNYEKRYRQNIATVIISGGGAAIRGITDSVRAFFETDVSLANPFSKVVAPAFLEEVLVEAGPDFAVALGVALRKLEENS